MPEIQRGSPYQGLIPYDEDDAAFFFGREKEKRLITANLFAAPLTLLYGESGVGKSSILRAGVVHQLRQRRDVVVVVFDAWQSDPVSGLKAAIANTAAGSIGRLDLPSQSAPLPEYLAAWADRLNRRLMVILDQFEEYFLYHPQNDSFTVEFPKGIGRSDLPVSFLISIREDALAKLDRFEGRIPTLFDNLLRLEHLNHEAARAAIEKPIEQYNRLAADKQPVSVEPDLAKAVLEQVKAGRVILGETGRGVVVGSPVHAEERIETPYLQLVMTRLWHEEMSAGSLVLRFETLKSLGGAERIVRTHLDEAMEKLSEPERDVSAHLFHYLVTPSGGKIAHTVRDLAGYAKLSQTQIAPVLEKLCTPQIRILRPVAPPFGQAILRYEIFHDVLAPAILDWRTRHVQAQERAEAEHRAEEQMRRAEEQARLYEQIKRLVDELTVSRDELQKANRTKDEFLSVMSHELRTPLSVITGYTGMLKDKMLGEINPEEERALEAIIRRSVDLSVMINNIFKATKLATEADKVESHEVSLEGLLNNLRSHYDVPLNKQLTLIWDQTSSLPVVRTDGAKLKDILQNLIDNALKFTEKGHVTVSARYFPETNTAEFKVSDTGIGVPKEAMPMIFDVFRQVDSSETRVYGGVGLGLYLVKKFTEMLGGKLKVESEPGKGSTFTVTIPCET